MKRVGIIGICLAAVFALSAAASASAALPEFTGPFPKTFELKSGPTTLATSTGLKVKCSVARGEGKITSAQMGTLTIKFVECQLAGLPCGQPAGATPGEIATSPLTATLGYVNSAAKEVGLDLQGAPSVAVFECGGVGTGYDFVVKGSVIGKLSPVNKLQRAGAPFKLRFARIGNKQKIMSFEGGAKDVLESTITTANGTSSGESALSAGAALRFSELEPLEIKA